MNNMQDILRYFSSMLEKYLNYSNYINKNKFIKLQNSCLVIIRYRNVQGYKNIILCIK